jgi:hypothetical protein
MARKRGPRATALLNDERLMHWVVRGREDGQTEPRRRNESVMPESVA